MLGTRSHQVEDIHELVISLSGPKTWIDWVATMIYTFPMLFDRILLWMSTPIEPDLEYSFLQSRLSRFGLHCEMNVNHKSRYKAVLPCHVTGAITKFLPRSMSCSFALYEIQRMRFIK